MSGHLLVVRHVDGSWAHLQWRLNMPARGRRMYWWGHGALTVTRHA